MSPSWLKPRVMMPSQDFEANVQATMPFLQARFAEIIQANCRVACFDFYNVNKLFRTKYSSRDLSTDPKVFQLDGGGFPSIADNLTLQDWLVRIQRTVTRLNYDDGINTSAFHDWSGMDDILSRAAKICSMIDYRGRLDVEDFEENLLIGLQICRHLNGWMPFGRLKALWEDLHKPFADYGDQIDYQTGGLIYEIELQTLLPPAENTTLASEPQGNYSSMERFLRERDIPEVDYPRSDYI